MSKLSLKWFKKSKGLGFSERGFGVISSHFSALLWKGVMLCVSLLWPSAHEVTVGVLKNIWWEGECLLVFWRNLVD